MRRTEAGRLVCRGIRAAAIMVAVAAPLSGQTVTGRLLESGSRTPLLLGTVALLDTTMTVVAQTITNDRGEFQLDAPRPGAYFVIANRVGYRGAIDGILDMGAGGFVEVEFYLQPEPLMLDELRVEAERQRVIRHLQDQGFYQRMTEGMGYFITPEDIDERPPFGAHDLLRGIPRLAVRSDGLGGSTLEVRSGRGGTCTPRVYVNGTLSPVMEGSPVVLEQVVTIDDIEAVEVYIGAAATPLQWGGSEGSCGVILFWTRREAPDR